MSYRGFGVVLAGKRVITVDGEIRPGEEERARCAIAEAHEETFVSSTAGAKTGPASAASTEEHAATAVARIPR